MSGSQFPWMKLFRVSNLAKMTDTPLSHVSDAAYITAAHWINQRSHEALSSFLLWSLDGILAYVAFKNAVQQVASKSQVAMFSVLRMVLRTKPHALITLLPSLREDAKYQGQDKLPVIVWMIAQASEGDLSVGLYDWARNLLHLVSGKSGNYPQ